MEFYDVITVQPDIAALQVAFAYTRDCNGSKLKEVHSVEIRLRGGKIIDLIDFLELKQLDIIIADVKKYIGQK